MFSDMVLAEMDAGSAAELPGLHRSLPSLSTVRVFPWESGTHTLPAVKQQLLRGRRSAAGGKDVPAGQNRGLPPLHPGPQTLGVTRCWAKPGTPRQTTMLS